MANSVLVTGGAGFVGSHLCKKLLDNGDTVICLDNFMSGRQENVKHLLDNPRFSIVDHDVINPMDFKVNRIYNLACPASPPRYQHDPIHTTKTSVLGAINVLELARKNNARVLQASTSEVYGDPDVHPQPESYWGKVNPNGLRSCYDEGKRCAETLFFDYNRVLNVDIRVVRIFNTYGPNMDPDDGRVVSNFVVQALKNEPITIYGDGTQTRSFQYVDDLVEGMVRMMNNKTGFIGPVNLGNPVEFTMNELAKLVTKLIPESKSRVVYRPLPSDDPRQRKPDIRLAQKNLKWKPSVPLEKGLLPTISYFRGLLSN